MDKVLESVPVKDELMNDNVADNRTSVASDVAPCAEFTLGPDNVAVKHDNAIVDMEKWDRWSVVRLFDALRDLLLRQCRHNAFKGLCKYLQAKQGDELVQYPVVL